MNIDQPASFGTAELVSPRGRSVLGPRNSSIWHLLGRVVTEGQFVTDLSPWGMWNSWDMTLAPTLIAASSGAAHELEFYGGER